MTKNSKIILELINASYEHPTAEVLYEMLEGTEQRMSLATVYNSLNWLCKEGLIKRLCLENQSDRYDKILRHDHAVCTECGAVSDVDFADLTKRLQRKSGKDILGYDLCIYHICDNCRQNQSL